MLMKKFIPRFKTGKELRLKLNNKVGSEPEQVITNKLNLF